MCAIPQLASAPLNPIPTAEHFRRSHPQCEHSYGQSKIKNRGLTELALRFFTTMSSKELYEPTSPFIRETTYLVQMEKEVGDLSFYTNQ